MKFRTLLWLAGVGQALACGSAWGNAIDAADAVEGRWEGMIEIPGAPLQVIVKLEREGDAWSGSVDIPAQAAAGLPLVAIDVAEHEGGEGAEGGEDAEGAVAGVAFEIGGVPGQPTFRGHLEAGGELRGTFEQGGVAFPFLLKRAGNLQSGGADPGKPQEPQPPFPYSIEDARFENGAMQRAGTLTVPSNRSAPPPAVLLISGSGLQDRDCTLFGHKPFWVLADRLTRSGIAVLRVDDAGTGGSTPHGAGATTEDFAADADAGVDFLQGDQRFGSVGLIGHSEGALIAAMLAGRRADIGFTVLLASPGVRGDALLRRQNERILGARGIGEERQRRLLALSDKLHGILASNVPDSEMERQVEEVVRAQLALGGVSSDADQVHAVVAQAVAQARDPWFRHFLAYDPIPSLAKVRTPVLALNGELDVQVDAEQNLPAVRAALAEAGNDNVTALKLPGLNHLFQTAETGLPEEYSRIEETLAESVIEIIRDWVLEQAF